jgi:predicted CoA-binding protein
MTKESSFDLDEAVQGFLSQQRIAVAGPSRSGGGVGNAIYKKLRETGYEVFPVNPKAETIEGDPCFPNLASIPGGVDAVMVTTPANVSADVVRESAQLGIGHVWLHRSFGTGSVSEEALNVARDTGIAIIPGACPMMFCSPVDFGHKCMKWMLRMGGKLPG